MIERLWLKKTVLKCKVGYVNEGMSPLKRMNHMEDIESDSLGVSPS